MKSQNIFPQITEFSNLASAWQRVKDNHGCAGTDGETIERFEDNLFDNLSKLTHELQDGSYNPYPLMLVQVEKPNGGIRSLSIPTVRDRVAQAAVLQITGPIFEAEFENCSFAYRKGRSVKQAVLQIRKYRDKGYSWVVDADIDSFFVNLDHALLSQKISELFQEERLCVLLEKWIKAEVYDGQGLTLLEKGIPQGSVISPSLANLFLDELDEEFLQQGYKLIRYSDDFIIMCRSQKRAQTAMELSDEILERMHLDLKEEKTSITSFKQGFSFLGVTFVRNLIMTPFDKPKKEHKLLSMPGYLSQEEYQRLRKGLNHG